MRRVLRHVLAGSAAVAGSYAAYVAYAWCRYGQPSRPAWWDRDEWLDEFMPTYDVVERHHVAVDGPPEVVLAAACEQRMSELPLVRGIFKARELVLGSTPRQPAGSRGLLAETTALGWVVLREVPGREVIVGAVTKPWEADVTFRGIAPEHFAAFAEPGYVKIVWTLRAHPAGAGRSIFRTETRALATDADARRKFRWYWALLSPGIIAIRWLAAANLKSQLRHVLPNFEKTIQYR